MLVMENDEKTCFYAKQMIRTSRQCAEHLFAGQNTPHIFSPPLENQTKIHPSWMPFNN